MLQAERPASRSALSVEQKRYRISEERLDAVKRLLARDMESWTKLPVTLDRAIIARRTLRLIMPYFRAITGVDTTPPPTLKFHDTSVRNSILSYGRSYYRPDGNVIFLSTADCVSPVDGTISTTAYSVHQQLTGDGPASTEKYLPGFLSQALETANALLSVASVLTLGTGPEREGRAWGYLLDRFSEREIQWHNPGQNRALFPYAAYSIGLNENLKENKSVADLTRQLSSIAHGEVWSAALIIAANWTAARGVEQATADLLKTKRVDAIPFLTEVVRDNPKAESGLYVLADRELQRFGGKGLLRPN